MSSSINALTPNYIRQTEYAAAASGTSGAGALRQDLNAGIIAPGSDSVKVSAFDNSGRPGASTEKLSELYQKRDEAQKDISDSEKSKNDKQSAVNDRKEQLIKDKQDGKGQNQVQQEYEKAKKEYDEINAKKSQADREAAAAQQKCSAKDGEISKNAGEISAKSGELSSARSALAAAQAKASQASSAEGEGQGSSNDNSGEIAGLQAKVNALEAELNRLQEQADKLQGEKEQLAREQQDKQEKSAGLDKELQSKQEAVNQCEQKMRAEDSDLDKTLSEDTELKNLQNECENIQQELDVKQKDLRSLEDEIRAAEQENVEIQEARSDYAHSQLIQTAEDAGYDTAASAAGAQEAAAQDKYGVPYDALSDEEKLSIASQIDGEITLDLMETARQRLRENPGDEAAAYVLEKGGQDLEARQNWAKSSVDSVIDSLPYELKNEIETIKGFAEGSTTAEGTALDSEVMQAISQGILEKLDSSDYSDEEKAALRETLNAADAYADAIEQKYAGAEIALNESDGELAKAKADMAKELGVDVDDLIVMQGTDGNDDITITPQEGGALQVSINGRTTDLSAEEAKLLFIDGGKGDDTIALDDKKSIQTDHLVSRLDPYSYNGVATELVQGITTDLHIYGGDGDDTVQGGEGSDVIYGGKGHDIIRGGGGSDYIDAGQGSDTVYGDAGSDLILGGEGDDYIFGNDGEDSLFGGEGSDYIAGGLCNDEISGGDGDDKLIGDEGQDTLFSGSGTDYVDGRFGQDTVYADVKNDTVKDGFIVKDEVNQQLTESEKLEKDLIEERTEQFFTLNKGAGKGFSGAAKIAKKKLDADKQTEAQKANAEAEAGSAGAADASADKSPTGGSRTDADTDNNTDSSGTNSTEASSAGRNNTQIIANGAEGAAIGTSAIQNTETLGEGLIKGDPKQTLDGTVGLIGDGGNALVFANDLAGADNLSAAGKFGNGVGGAASAAGLASDGVELLDHVGKGEWGEAFASVGEVSSDCQGVTEALTALDVVGETAGKAAGKAFGAVGGGITALVGAKELVVDGIAGGDFKAGTKGALKAISGGCAAAACISAVAPPVAIGLIAVSVVAGIAEFAVDKLMPEGYDPFNP